MDVLTVQVVIFSMAMFLTGKYYCGGTIKLTSTPATFYKSAEFGKPPQKYGSYSGTIKDHHNFYGGYFELSSPKPCFTSNVISLAELEATAKMPGGLYYSSGLSSMEFFTTGSAGNLVGKIKINGSTIIDYPDKQIIYVNGGINSLKGRVLGRLTVVAKNDIYITSDLVYVDKYGKKPVDFQKYHSADGVIQIMHQ